MTHTNTEKRDNLIKVLEVITETEKHNLSNKELNLAYDSVVSGWLENTLELKVIGAKDNFYQDETDSIIKVYGDSEGTRGMHTREKIVGKKEDKIKAFKLHLENAEELLEKLENTKGQK